MLKKPRGKPNQTQNSRIINTETLIWQNALFQNVFLRIKNNPRKTALNNNRAIDEQRQYSGKNITEIVLTIGIIAAECNRRVSSVGRCGLTQKRADSLHITLQVEVKTLCSRLGSCACQLGALLFFYKLQFSCLQSKGLR